MIRILLLKEAYPQITEWHPPYLIMRHLNNQRTLESSNTKMLTTEGNSMRMDLDMAKV